MLPIEYFNIAETNLKEYFPLDFEIDFNGKSKEWEAIYLVPFGNENVFLSNEEQIKI